MNATYLTHDELHIVRYIFLLSSFPVWSIPSFFTCYLQCLLDISDGHLLEYARLFATQNNDPTSFSFHPTIRVSFVLTFAPTALPTHTPSAVPTVVLSMPTITPTVTPSAPTFIHSYAPTGSPSFTPTQIPTAVPTEMPTAVPTYVPTDTPTRMPSLTPTAIPTAAPSRVPTITPTGNPSFTPTSEPSYYDRRLAGTYRDSKRIKSWLKTFFYSNYKCTYFISSTGAWYQIVLRWKLSSNVKIKVFSWHTIKR